MLLVAIFATAACGSAQRANLQESADMFRDPHPTFTPTAGAPGAAPAEMKSVIQPAQTGVVVPSADSTVNSNLAQPSLPLPTAASEAAQPSLPLPTPTEVILFENPTGVVNAPLVNLRAESNARSEVVDAVERGAEFEIIGRSSDDQWWHVCCYDGQEVWIAQELVDIIGDVDDIAITDSSGEGQALPNAGGPVAATGGGVATVDPEARFDLESKEQFSKEGSVRVYVYIHDGDTPLAGYGLRVLKDGQEVPTDDLSFGGQPGTTWPFQDARQRHQNLKVELEGVAPEGTWSVQPVNSQGVEVGPPAQFLIQVGDANLELYVRYGLIQ